MAGNWLATRTGWTVRRLADRLALQERRLDALAAGDVRVSAAFDLSYRQLTPSAARLFRFLALVDGPDASVAVSAQLTGQEFFDTEDILEELVETGLLGSDQDRYRLHDLLKLYARDRLKAEETEEAAAAARSALHRWLLETAVVASRWFEPDHGAPPPTWQGTVDLSTADHARQWLQMESINWLAAFRTAAHEEDHAAVVELAEALHWFSDQWIFWGHWPEVSATAAACAQALGDPGLEATHLNLHAWALLICEGRHHASMERSAEALKAAQRANDLPQQAWSHSYTAWALSQLGDYSAAAPHNREAARLFEAAGDMHGTLHAMSSHADTLLRAGRYEESIAEHLRTLAFLDQASDSIEPHSAAFNRTNVQTSIGQAQTLLKNWAKAADHLRIAVDLARASANPGLESRALIHLADALHAADIKNRPARSTPSAWISESPPTPSTWCRPESAWRSSIKADPVLPRPIAVPVPAVGSRARAEGTHLGSPFGEALCVLLLAPSSQGGSFTEVRFRCSGRCRWRLPSGGERRFIPLGCQKER
ncbi:hypothetical protein ACFQ51_54345 [Streptomyces kaempferi]